jgi:hypothetical protein
MAYETIKHGGRTLSRWIPPGAMKISEKHGWAVVYVYTNTAGRLCAVGYRGNAGHNEFNFSYANQAQIATKVKDFFEGVAARKAQVAGYRADHKTNVIDGSRDDTIQKINAALKARGLRYSVTGGRGTAWGWITIDLMPAVYNGLDEAGRTAAYRKLGDDFLEARRTSISIPAGSDYYREYIERAQGLKPAVCGTPYWD